MVGLDGADGGEECPVEAGAVVAVGLVGGRGSDGDACDVDAGYVGGSVGVGDDGGKAEDSAERFVFVESWGHAEMDVGLPPNVVLLPRLPTLTPLYRRARLLLVPSVVSDACPRVILEGAAHGVPAIGSDRGGIPELIANRANLLAFDDHDGWTGRAQRLLAVAPEWAAAQHSQLALVGALRQEPARRLAQLGFPAPEGRR